MSLEKAVLEMLPTVKHVLNYFQPWQPVGDWKGTRVLHFYFGPNLVREPHDAGCLSMESSFINMTLSQRKYSYILIRSISNTFTRRKQREGHA